jgi:hypothetical protein
MQGLLLKGKVMSSLGQKGLSNHQVNIVPLDGMGQMATTTSDEDGNFEFRNLQMFRGAQYFLQATREGAMAQNARFEVEWPLPQPKGTIEVVQGQMLESDQSKAYLAYADRKQKIDSMYNFTDEILLDEITIRGKSNALDGPRSWHGNEFADDVLNIDQSMYGFSNLLDLLAGRLAGVSIYRNPEGREQLSIRGSAQEPLILLDGFQLNYPMAAGYSPTDMRTILSMNIPDIDRVEVLRDVSSAGIYGLQAFGGVIAIFSKEGGRAVEKTIATKTAKGYEPGTFFSGPNYEVEDQEHAKPDLRTTLYWDGAMQLDQNGVYEAKFFSSDNSRRYLVIVEGISDQGKPITWIKTLPR